MTLITPIERVKTFDLKICFDWRCFIKGLCKMVTILWCKQAPVEVKRWNNMVSKYALICTDI